MPADSAGASAPHPPGQKILARPKLLAAIILSLSLIGASFFFDATFRDHFAAQEKPGWKKTAYHRTASLISKQGDWPQLMLVGGLSILLAWKLRRRDWVQIMAAACLASTAAGLLANSLRLTTGRARPRDEINQGAGFHGLWKDGRLTIGQPGLNSYPSGHTATAFGFAVPIVLAQPVVGVPVLAGAAAIAWSRMALGAHHFSDVVTSIVLSGWVGWWVLGWVRTRGGGFWVVLIGKLRAGGGGKNASPP
jgi:membrane-associated phospholipid phosphatase